MQLAMLVNYLFEIVFWLIIVTIFLSWIPNIDWSHPFLQFLRKFTDAILSPFRNIIPPINGLDLSPIIALIALQIIQVALVRLLVVFVH